MPEATYILLSPRVVEGSEKVRCSLEYRLTITASAIQHLLKAPSGDRAVVTIYRVGLCRLPQRIEWLLHDTRAMPPAGLSTPRLVAVRASDTYRLRAALEAQWERAPSDAPTVWLALGTGPATGYIAAAYRAGTDIRRITSVSIVGPGMIELRFPDANEGQADKARLSDMVAIKERPASPEVIWSRTIGALGDST